jgi:hypothetical protein
MNKQQLLDLDNPTEHQEAVQTILASNSKTNLEAVRRVLTALAKILFKSKFKQMTLQQIIDAVHDALKLATGEHID